MHENKFFLKTNGQTSQFLLNGLAKGTVSVNRVGSVQQVQDMFRKLEAMVTCKWFEAGVPTFHRGKILMIICLQSLSYFRALNSVGVATVYKSMPVTLPKLFFHKKQELSAIWMSLTFDISKGLNSFWRVWSHIIKTQTQSAIPYVCDNTAYRTKAEFRALWVPSRHIK